MMGKINKETLETVENIFNANTSWVDMTNGFKSWSDGDKAGAGLSTLKTLHTFFDLLGKTSLKTVAPLVIASGYNNISKAFDELADGDYIEDDTLLDIASDVATALGLGLGYAAVATASTPLLITALGIGTIGGTLLSAVALFQGGTELSEALAGAFNNLIDTMNAVGDAFGDVLSDQFFPGGVTEDQSLEELTHGLPYYEDIKDAMEDPSKPGIDPGVNEDFQDAMGNPPCVDPFVLDLDGDGVQTTAAETNSVLFDGDGDGIRTSTGWVNSDDGLLVLDRNANGTIDSGRELFGDATVMPDGTIAEDGFEALSALDSNSDGAISALDERFSELRLWQDANADGISQSAELKTLSAYDIESILLGKTSVRKRDSGNVINATGSYVRSDGTLGAAAELDFASRPFYSDFADQMSVDNALLSLPRLSGSGEVRDLREAASLSGALAALVQQYAAAPTRAVQQALLDDLITAWTDTSDMPTLSDQVAVLGIPLEFYLGDELLKEGDPGFDAWVHKLEAVERFNGRSTATVLPEENLGDTATATFSQEAADSLNESYEGIRRSIYYGLLLQTRLKDYVDALDYSVGAGGAPQIDFSGLQSLAAANINSDLVNGLTDIIEFHQAAGRLHQDGGWQGWPVLVQTLQSIEISDDVQAVLDELHVSLAGAGASTLAGDASSELLVGNELNNTAEGFAGSDRVFGYDGADDLSGGEDDDVLKGGLGADTLHGDEGNDALAGNDGNDALHGDSGNDVLDGGAGNDTLTGGIGVDILRGGAGDDTLGQEYGASGSKVFEGGTGNDTIRGASYGDTYRFGPGDGQDRIEEHGPYGLDTLRFGDGINPADILVDRTGNDLVLHHVNGVDQITVADWYNDSDRQLERVEFTDGTVWDYETLHTPGLTLTGTLGDDDVSGGNVGGETLIGLGGDDTLRSFDGSDTLNGGVGADALFGDHGDDVLAGGDGADALEGSYGDDFLTGDGGNDTLNGGNDDDVLEGGAGNDTLDGRNGSDILRGGAGDDVINDLTTNGSLDDVNVFVGGAGNDTLRGGLFGDVYRFNLGDGQDRIEEYGYFGSDVVRFGEGIDPADIRIERTGNDLVLGHVNGVDRIVVAEWYTDAHCQLERVEFTDGTVWDYETLHTPGLTLTGTAGDDVIAGGNVGEETLTGLAGNDILRAHSGDDVLTGGAGDDTLYGGYGVNTLTGGDGDDTLYGDEYDDTLDGGAGSDIFDGGTGNDWLKDTWGAATYIYELGDGQDFIEEYGSEASHVDVLKFGEAITPADIQIMRDGTDLVLRESYSQGSVTVWGWYEQQGYQIERVEFADGTVWNSEMLNTIGQMPTGTDGNDTLAGTGADEIIKGLAGDDTISGGGGADVLRGGDGVDMLNGDAGNDMLDGGYGADTLSGGAGDDVVGGDTDSDDYYGFGNTYDGGAGADTLRGTISGDLYLFEQGHGHDVIQENWASIYSDDDILRFGEGTSPADIELVREGTDLKLQHAGGLDSVTFERWYDTAGYENHQVEQVEFADGTVWSQYMLNEAGLTLEGSAEDDVLVGGESGEEALYGLAGHDTLKAKGGWDYLYGGAGADSLHGGDGNDELYGSDGDDLLDGGYGEDTYDGGAGDDILGGADGSDDWMGNGNTYNGGQGDDLLRGGGNDNLYLIGSDSDHDRIQEDKWFGEDTLRFLTSTELDQLWFSQVGNDLNISVIGTDDQVTVEEWYSDPDNARVERIELSSEQVLLESQVQQLVDAMASFDPPASGQTSLSPDVAQALEPVIAASWQSSAA